MTTDEEKQNDIAMIEKCVAQLGEHFDTVQIFCTKVIADGERDAVSYQDGSGNWYARVGQIHEWLTRNDQRIRDQQTGTEDE